jgi:hypothetical protein
VLRFHLFEFGDQRWFPQTLRDAETAYLAACYRLLPKLLQWCAERILPLLPAGDPARILDLCSGAGGPIPLLVEELEKRGCRVRVTLTDRYPNPAPSSDPRVAWLGEPVDAARVPPELEGVRTLFSAFHHFRPEDASAILKDAFDRRRPICVFEGGSGTVLGACAMLGVPLAVLALMPLARPFRWAYFVFTYLIPLLPFLVWWDGMVSLARIYSPEQLKQLTADMQAPGYVWEIGRAGGLGIPGGLPYLIGRPVPNAVTLPYFP